MKMLVKEIVDNKRYEEKIRDLESLFLTCFGRPAHRDFFKWRYINNPYNDILAAFAYDEHRLVANYSTSPNRLVYDENEYHIALSMTTMTDSEYSGRGLFTDLANMVYERMMDKKYLLVYGFPNLNSHRIFTSRLKWNDIHEIPTMSFAIDGVENDLEEDLCEDNGFNLDYSETQKYPGYMYVLKDKNYLKWRYSNNPNNDYLNFTIQENGRVSSYCVVKIYDGCELDIVDLQPENNSDARRLLNKVIVYSEKNGVQKINAWVPTCFFTRSIFEKIGFKLREPVTLFGAREMEQEGGSSIPYTEYSKWYIQMGDSDVY